MVSRQVARLETLGLVERQGAKGDQRVRLLEPSANGRQMLDRFALARKGFLSERLGDWTDEERRVLLELLGRFAVAIATARKTAEAPPAGRAATAAAPDRPDP